MISEKTYAAYKEKSVEGRYVTNQHISPFLDRLPKEVVVSKIGESVQKRDIHSISLGKGAQKLLFWSQMHGNEATTTKAALDFINFLCGSSEAAHLILANCTLKIIPILNPDGAAAYTRVNANAVDLNRDAQERSQPESKVLRKTYDDFQPDFCFNLHDQRTIYNVGATAKPATVSFLAPSHDMERSISNARGKSMQLIVAINKALQEVIPGQVGRYDDGFNANCVGDTFQMLNTPTLLFEAGHYPNDYQREETRKYIFQALVAATLCIAKDEIGQQQRADYALIPENQKMFLDVIIKNGHVIASNNSKDLGLLFVERLVNDAITFDVHIEKEGDLNAYFAHQTFDCEHTADLNSLKNQPYWNSLKSQFIE